MSFINPSIRIAVIGSNPEFGSSQNRYFGFIEIARAMPILFCIPPEHSEGNSVFLPLRLTLSRQKSARICISFFVILVNMDNGNITFSSAVNESKSAAP